MIRRSDDEGNLQVASWPEALDAAARGLTAARDAKGVGVLVGGRVSAEDAYAYSKFTRLALQTNDIDFRARPHSVEEAQFLASHVVATGPEGGAVTYADIERARTVVLVGFEPEDESPSCSCGCARPVRRNKTAVYAVAPFADPRPGQGGRHPDPVGARHRGRGPGGAGRRRPRRRPPGVAAAAEALAGERALVLVGERLAGVPGALSAAAALAASSGARLAWIPRRAGERGALETGALPGLLPGGRPVTEPAARAEVGEAWGVIGLPEQRPRHRRDDRRRRRRPLTGLLVGGVDPADLPEHAELLDALTRTFVVSLEVRESAVTAVADVVLPVAPHQEKAGTFVNWEGRVRAFEAALATNAMSDHRVPGPARRRDGGVPRAAHGRRRPRRHAGLRPLEGARAAAPTVPPPRFPCRVRGQAVLATWHHLLDSGRMQDGEPFLAGTAPRSRALLSAATAAAVGVGEGDL